MPTVPVPSSKQPWKDAAFAPLHASSGSVILVIQRSLVLAFWNGIIADGYWGDKAMGLYLPMLVGKRAPRKGQGLVEYILILMLISTAAVLVMSAFGTQVAQLYEKVPASF